LQKCVKGFVIIYIRLVSKDSVLRKKSWTRAHLLNMKDQRILFGMVPWLLPQ
jgi:type IV secretory pathway TrbF-like protein